MVRINLVLMILLCIGVVGAAVMLALGGGPQSETELQRLERLLYDASDSDADISRAARAEILESGESLTASLRTLAGSDDHRLSMEALRFLEKIERGKGVAGGKAPIRLELAMDAGVVGDGVVPMLDVAIINDGSEAVHVTTGAERDFHPFGWLEVRKPDGKWTACKPAETPPGGNVGKIEAVAPNSRYILSFPGTRLMESLEGFDSYELRFVFAAESGFDYRNMMLRDAEPRNLLPDVRLVSNVLRFRFVPPSS